MLYHLWCSWTKSLIRLFCLIKEIWLCTAVYRASSECYREVMSKRRLELCNSLWTQVSDVLSNVSAYQFYCQHLDDKRLQLITCVPWHLTYLYRVAQKTSRTFACIIHSSNRNESVQKHVCNDQISSNMCKNFRLKHLSFSRDTNKIASHAIKHFLQAVHHLRCRLYTGYAKTSQ